jgi:hypothetical protein
VRDIDLRIKHTAQAPIEDLGTEILTPLSVWTTLLNYGVLADDGTTCASSSTIAWLTAHDRPRAVAAGTGARRPNSAGAS